MAAKPQLPAEEIARARAIALRAIQDDPRGCAGVAARCGVKRSAISMFSRAKYPAGEHGIATAVIRALDGWTCPYTQSRTSPQDCRAIALGAAPTHNPARMAHWRCCQQCPGKPQEA